MPPHTRRMCGAVGAADELKMHVGEIDPTLRGELAVLGVDYGCGAYFLPVINYIVENCTPRRRPLALQNMRLATMSCAIGVATCLEKEIGCRGA